MGIAALGLRHMVASRASLVATPPGSALHDRFAFQGAARMDTRRSLGGVDC